VAFLRNFMRLTHYGVYFREHDENGMMAD